MVQAGDELASLYAPDLLVTVQNLLDANDPTTQHSWETREAAWNYWGSQRPDRRNIGVWQSQYDLTIRSPISGHVINSTFGRPILQEGTALYDGR